MAEKQSKNKWHTPAERIMMLGFAAVILLGTILLCLPVSAAEKRKKRCGYPAPGTAGADWIKEEKKHE